MKKDSNSSSINALNSVKPEQLHDITGIMLELPGLIVASGLNTDHAIEESLARVGMLFNASRVYVMLDEKQGRYLRNTHEWVNEQIAHSMFSWPLYDYEYDIPSLKNMLQENKVVCGHTRNMPKDLQHILAKQHVQSFCIVALVRDGTRLGLVGMDFCDSEHENSEGLNMLLGYLAGIVSLALERKQYQIMRGKLNTIRDCIHDIEPILAGHKEDQVQESRPAKPVTLLDAERRIIIETLELYHGNKLKTAKHLGLTWPSLDRRCKKLGVEVKRR